MLSVSGTKIVDEEGAEVHLRGVGIGGYLHLENFINGYPGTGDEQEAVLRSNVFFRSMRDHFFTEQDVAFIRSTGANTIRLPLNYRLFESDDAPFQYLEEGFARVDAVVEWCARSGMYVVLDAHAVPGWQNTDWSSDNATGRALFWKHPHFQDRFVRWWEKLAERYRDNRAVAGYDLLNEPVANAPPSGGFDKASYEPGWEALNRLYDRTVSAIRAVDPRHVIFLEGEGYSERFEGLSPPFADNLVYSCHDYIPDGFGPGAYDGDRDRLREEFHASEGYRFAERHGVPLWVGEFGAVFNGPADEVDDRLRALDDQLAVYDDDGIHWSMWTYKDCGVLGWVTLDPDSDYMKLTAPLREKKCLLDTDFWLHWLPDSPFRKARRALARHVRDVLASNDVHDAANDTHVSLALSTYIGALLQPSFAKLFDGMSERELSDVLESFDLDRCLRNEPLLSVIGARTTASGSRSATSPG